jgi:hypothetical protein
MYSMWDTEILQYMNFLAFLVIVLALLTLSKSFLETHYYYYYYYYYPRNALRNKSHMTYVKSEFICVIYPLLTFKNRASYIYDGRTATLQMLEYIYFFSANLSTEYFKHAAHSPFFSSKCRLIYNATFFGSRIIHILQTKCAKI